uniref:Uncharacterized protein n=1 Tax=Cucumis melo TaxID=3656 RepID=A0A9I9CSA4_CUCME
MVNPKEKARSYDCTNEVGKTLKTEAERKRTKKKKKKKNLIRKVGVVVKWC